jgi:O-antigen ligase
METEDRDEVAGYALKLCRDYPAFGSGLGSFSVLFTRYGGPDLYEHFTHAHNDYIQFGCETGAAGVLPLGLMVFASFLAALRAQMLRHDPLMRGISFGAMMSMIALALHSAVDFNLQIPANALTFMLVLAFAWISRFHGTVSAKDGTENAPGEPAN